MKELDLLIQNPTGLHARPAKVFVNAAKQFQSDIRVQHGPKKANAKSLISMLTLGVECGSAIRIIVNGADEDEAAAALGQLVADGLGEGELIEAEATTAPAQTPSAAAPAAPLAENQIRAIPASPGIAIGPVFRLRQQTLSIDGAFTSVAEEAARLQTAVAAAQTELAGLRDEMAQRTAEAEAAIFDVHLELLNDPSLIEATEARIQTQLSAPQAWQAAVANQAAAVAALSDPLLAARAADLHDVGNRVLRLLVGAGNGRIQLPDYPVVLVAHDLAPSDTAALDTARVLGFCTAVGGPTAHSAIIARALGLPAVVSAGDGVLDLADDTQVILDGNQGVLTVAPDAAAVAQARRAQQSWQAGREAARAAAQDPAVTLDGHRVEVVANIGGAADAEKAVVAGAEGVGLLRTEFLFLDRSDAPDEEEQTGVYRAIVAHIGQRPLIVRTLDIGGDKPLPYIDVPPEANPFLGERGIRLCLNRPELLRQQLRAILRAAPGGHIHIMFPMVADAVELRAARQLVNDVTAELGAPAVPVGIMIEIPSAALMADVLAPEVDFFSIGTNDLTQYTLAMDRQHPLLASRLDGLHPAVLRLIAKTVEAAHAAGKWVGICGELGSDPQAVPILVGLGVDELSVSVPSIAAVKAQIRALSLADARALAQKALACPTATAVRELVAPA